MKKNSFFLDNTTNQCIPTRTRSARQRRYTRQKHAPLLVNRTLLILALFYPPTRCSSSYYGSTFKRTYSRVNWGDSNRQRHVEQSWVLDIPRGGGDGQDSETNRWSLFSLFQSMEDAKDRAANEDREEDVMKGRGGGGTVVAVRKKKEDIAAWPDLLDGTAVSTASSRLLNMEQVQVEDNDALETSDTPAVQEGNKEESPVKRQSLEGAQTPLLLEMKQTNKKKKKIRVGKMVNKMATAVNEGIELLMDGRIGMEEEEELAEDTERTIDEELSQFDYEEESEDSAIEEPFVEDEPDKGEELAASETHLDASSIIRPPLEAEEPVVEDADQTNPKQYDSRAFLSSGKWVTIDKIASLGLSTRHPSVRVSRYLRPARKAAARITGLHGALSGKGRNFTVTPDEAADKSRPRDIQRRIDAIERAREKVREVAEEEVINRRRRPRRRFGLFGRRIIEDDEEFSIAEIPFDDAEELRRKERVKEIDRLIVAGQTKLLELQCEKDALQRRPNPLYNYTAAGSGKRDELSETHSREFNFPPPDMVDEYLEYLFMNGRLVKLNHTQLWKSGAGESDDDDYMTDDEDYEYSFDNRGNRNGKRENGDRRGNGNGGGGSWLLRQGSIGGKIGETIETSAYKAVCSAVMAALARSISSLHGINIMTHSDIRLFMESAPDFPSFGAGGRHGDNYAQEAIKHALSKALKKGKGQKNSPFAARGQEDDFIQRDAVVETLISHCQISAPLLKLFPLAWQRALLANIITLITSIMSDFADGIQFQILGYQLSFSFSPITEVDMLQRIGMASADQHRARPEEFEAAVRATAKDVSASLEIFDKWHEKMLGGEMLRSQIATLIARIILTLADDVLSGATMNLWSAQAAGPRMVAGLEYRTAPDSGQDSSF